MVTHSTELARLSSRGLQVDYSVYEEAGWEDGIQYYVAPCELLTIKASHEVESGLLGLVILKRKPEMRSHREIPMPVLQELIDRELRPEKLLLSLRREGCQ